jgi:hypothetical protein
MNKYVFILINLKRIIISIIRKFLGTVLWNRSYFLRFRIRLLTSYGSGSRKKGDQMHKFILCL